MAGQGCEFTRIEWMGSLRFEAAGFETLLAE